MFFKSLTNRILIYTILFIPLFFINVRSSHDWGDDFAQYINQAKKIVEGKPQTTTGYIFNPDQPFVGPPVYSVGYPLLLAPVYWLFGNNIKIFDIYNSLFLILLGVSIIYFLSTLTGELIAVFLAVILIYNPWTLSFKCEVGSDFSFAFILIPAALLYINSNSTNNKKNIFNCIACGLLTGFIILIKSTGLVLLIAIIIDILIKIINTSGRDINKNAILQLLLKLLFITSTILIVYFIFNYVIFNIHNGTLHYFKFLYGNYGMKETFLHNIAYYINMLQNFFHPKVILWEFLPLICKSFVLTFFVLGLINELFKKIAFMEIFVIVYLFAICFFPNSTQGIRYLFPLLPFIMYFVVKGLKTINLNLKINQKIITICLAFICISYYKTGITNIIKDQSSILQGPQETEAIEAFNYIKNNTKPTDTIVFIKPRALALYTERYSFTNNRMQDSLSLNKKFNELKPKLFLITSDNYMENTTLNNFINSHSKDLISKFKNSKFELFQLKNQLTKYTY